MEKSKDPTHADHVARAEANLFSPAVTFDGLCPPTLPRVPRLRANLHLFNSGKTSIMPRPGGFVGGIRILRQLYRCTRRRITASRGELRGSPRARIEPIPSLIDPRIRR